MRMMIIFALESVFTVELQRRLLKLHVIRIMGVELRQQVLMMDL